jgi:hypothetical protein
VVLAFAFAASLLASDQHARRFDYRALLAGLGTLLLGWPLLYFFIGFADWRRTERSRLADCPGATSRLADRPAPRRLVGAGWRL